MTARIDSATPATGAERSTAPRHEDAVLRYYSALAEEVRSPLNALAGWVELLAVTSDADVAAEAKRSAQIVLGRLRRLCDDARDSAVIALGELRLRRQRVDLADIVERVTASRPGVRYERPEDRVIIEGDRERLAQVVDTVLSVTAAHGDVAVTLQPAGAWVELIVATEAPLPFEAVEGLFAPFSRPPRPGRPLGLYVSRALVAAHGGETGVSAGDGPSTLWVRLPVAPPPAV